SLAGRDRRFVCLERHTEISGGPEATELKVSNGAIRFDHVGFSYESRRQILQDVSFDIPAGHKVAVVGASGRGKSTLSRLLFRFYDFTAGRILIDGQDIRAVTQKSLRRAIGILPQYT